MSTPDPSAPTIAYAHGASLRKPLRRKDGFGGWGIFFTMPFVWVVPFLILTSIVGAFSGMLFGPAIAISPLATFVLLYAVHVAVNDNRRSNGRVIVGYVETAVRLNLPLYEFLSAAKRSERGRRARQLGHLCALLEAGAPVGAALAELPDVPWETAARIAAGEAMGQLRPSVLRTQAFDHQADQDRYANPDLPVYRIYPLFLLLASASLIEFTLIVVAPKFKDIFRDFRTTLPLSTQLLLGISTFLTDRGLGIVLLIALPALLMLLVSTYMTNIFLPSLPLPNLSPAGAWLAWRLPLFRGIQRDRSMAEACELLGACIAQGAPLLAALESAQQLPVNPGFRRQLERFRTGLLEGAPANAAAARAGLPPLLVGFLALPATSNEALAAMFNFLGRHYRQRFSRAVLFIRNAYVPLLVMGMGFVIGFIMVALFSPLVKLIQSVMGPELGGSL